MRDGYLNDATMVRAESDPQGWRSLGEVRASTGLAPSAAVPTGVSPTAPLSPAVVRDVMQNAKMDLGVALAAMTIGLVITWVTYNHAASVGRGRYRIAYGPVLWGFIKAARAMAVLRS